MKGKSGLVLLATLASAGASNGSLVHEWKLNESAGTTASDSVAITNAALGGSSAWVGAKQGNGFKTTGSTLGYVNAGNVPLTGSFSISFWVKPEDVTLDWRNMVSKHDGASGARSFWIGQKDTSGLMRFGMYFDGSNETALDTTLPVIATNAWSLVTATWNEATKVQSLYVDGVLRASATRTGQTFNTSRASNLLFSTNSTS
ncbi:MAG: LamG domain-containing protein, partial [Tepidisphaeraceae bacterium]